MKFNFNWQTITGIYGAVVSTILGLLKIMEYRENKPKLLIKINILKMTSSGSNWTKPQFAIMISNISNKTITIYTVAI